MTEPRNPKLFYTTSAISADITLRDLFAGLFGAAWRANPAVDQANTPSRHLAAWAAEDADALLAELAKETP